MKNKIIALFLVAVMAVLALASCSNAYDYTDGNLENYITVSDGFLEALSKIEIEDADFTTNEETRQKKVTAAIYSTLASYAEKNGEKKTEGEIDANDTFYYAYYITYTKEGKVYAYNVDEYMKETASPKSSIKLSLIDVNDKDADKLSMAIKNALKFDEAEKYVFDAYKTSTTKKTDINKDTEFKTAFVSYTLTSGEGDNKQVMIANAAMIDLSATGSSIEAQIAAVLKNADNKVQIFDKDNYVEVYTGTEGETKNYSKTFNVTDGETTYECSNLKVLFAADKAGKEIEVSYKLTAETKLTATKIDSLHPENEEVTIPKDTEVTYHIYPVYYYEVSDASSAAAIVREALTEKVTVSTLDVFSDESYKNGDKTVKTLVEELVKVYAENTATKIADLKKTYDAAAKAVTDAGENATEAQKTAEADAKTAYENAKNAAANKIAEIVAAKNAEDKSVAEVIVEEYREIVYDSLEETYNDAIVLAVGKAIWKLIDKYAVLKTTEYPEKLIDEAKAHLYNQYEYEFYTKTNETTKESIYSEYQDKGGFDAYIVDVTKASNLDGVDAKIEEQAKAAVLPIMKIYAVAKVLSEGAKALPEQIKSHENVIKHLGEDGDRRDFETVEYFAENFYITEDVFEGYKKMVGKNEFEESKDSYGGETNIRVAHQISNIFDYLLMLDYEAPAEDAEDGEHVHAEIEYKEVDGKKYLPFYNISYTIKAEAESAK